MVVVTGVDGSDWCHWTHDVVAGGWVVVIVTVDVVVDGEGKGVGVMASMTDGFDILG